MRPFAARLAVAVLAAVLGCAACARPGESPSSPATVPATAGATPSPAAVDPTTAIHIEVLRRYLTSTSENSNLSGEVIYILDHTDPAAADPMAHNQGSSPIPAAERDAIESALKDIAPVRWVKTREAAMTDVDNCARVRDNGILMVIGPPKRSGADYHVGVHGFVACLGATWLTYVVQQSGSGWKVTGTTGSMAVA